MCLAVDTHENLVQMPAPVRIRMVLNAPFSDLRREHRAKTVPPEPYRLVADIDTAFEQQVLDLAQRQRVPDIHHHREANDFGRTIEIAEGIFHPLRLGSITRRLKPLYSDNALRCVVGFKVLQHV